MPIQFEPDSASGGSKPDEARPRPVAWPQAKPPRRWRDEMLGVTLAFVLGAGVVFAYPWLAQLASSFIAPRSDARITGLIRDPYPPPIPQFTLCWQSQQQDCVVDGDTLRFSGMIVRIADIDAPEVQDFKCPAEKALGDRATSELLRLVNAGPFQVVRYSRDVDPYGRKLRILTRNGTSIGEQLVAAGLARTWDGERHPWC